MFADFIAEMTSTEEEKRQEELPWTFFVDGSSSKTQYGIGILLESSHGVVIEKNLTIMFSLTSSQTKYEACSRFGDNIQHEGPTAKGVQQIKTNGQLVERRIPSQRGNFAKVRRKSRSNQGKVHKARIHLHPKREKCKSVFTLNVIQHRGKCRNEKCNFPNNPYP